MKRAETCLSQGISHFDADAIRGMLGNETGLGKNYSRVGSGNSDLSEGPCVDEGLLETE